MATQTMVTHRIGVLRLALTGAITAALVFLLCWVGTFIPFSSPTHAYIGLFTPAEMSSVAALAQGICWSFLFGGSPEQCSRLFTMHSNLSNGIDVGHS
jgi:hypothetical protein